jgi:hypothetical protein
VSQEDMDKLDSKEIESMDVIKKSDKATIRIVTTKFSKTLNDNDIYINGEKTDKKELLFLDQNSIDKMDVNKNEKTIRITTKTINQSSDNIDVPTPPTPPAPPVEKKETSPDKVVNGWKVSAMPATRNAKEMIVDDKNIDYKKAVIIIDGKISNSRKLNKLNPEEIASISVQKTFDGKQKEAMIQKYGDKALNGIIEIETKGFSNN